MSSWYLVIHRYNRDRLISRSLLAVAANYLLYHRLSKKILIIDLDVHQGNGTAKLFENNDCVFTFSMHGARNYPHRKEQSDLDLALPDGTDDATYLALLRDTLPRLLADPRFEVVEADPGFDSQLATLCGPR